VVYTGVILKDIHFGSNYDKVSLLAERHHEFLDGSGYPNHIEADELNTEMRLLTIMDIYESLTSTDRPYKKPMSPERAVAVLESMVLEGKLDRGLVELVKEYVNDNTKI